jgi:hypothetical protein
LRLKTDDNINYTLVTSENWINNDDLISAEFEGVLEGSIEEVNSRLKAIIQASKLKPLVYVKLIVMRSHHLMVENSGDVLFIQTFRSVNHGLFQL